MPKVTWEKIVAEHYDDPAAVIDGWVERMSLRWGKTLWDQIRYEEITWVVALTRAVRGPKHEWLLMPVWRNDEVEYAMTWERETFPECNAWPLWAMPMSKRDVKPCRPEDHKWTMTIEEGNMSLHCADPCMAGPKCTAEYIGGNEDRRESYNFGACIDIEDKWDNILESVYGEFAVRVVLERDGGSLEEPPYSEFVITPTFRTDSYICGHCGIEATKHRNALSRYDKGVRLCSPCGRKEAMKQFQLPIETEEADDRAKLG